MVLFLSLYLFGHAALVLGSSDQEFLAPLPEDTSRICPLPICERCPTARQIHGPGIGFALEMGYGYVLPPYLDISLLPNSNVNISLRHSTASIRSHDHSYQSTAHVEGQPAFLALMQRYATGPQNRVSIDDAASYWDKVRYLKGRTQRILNKAIGRPATVETAILADVVAKPKVQIEDTLTEGNKVTTAVLSSPDRIRLTEEEISDVFDYLKITNLMSIPDDLEYVYATSAAFAGFGFGLCRNYTDPYACGREERYFPLQRLLHIDFTLDGLSGTIKWLNSARNGPVDKTFIDINLGLGGRNAYPGGEEMYWTAVRDSIRTLVKSYRPRISQLILTGSSAENE